MRENEGMGSRSSGKTRGVEDRENQGKFGTRSRRSERKIGKIGEMIRNGDRGR